MLPPSQVISCSNLATGAGYSVRKPLSLGFGSGSNVNISWEAVSTHHGFLPHITLSRNLMSSIMAYMLCLIQLSHREFGNFLLGETHINISRVLPLMRPGRSVETFEWEFLYSIDNFQIYYVHYFTVSSALYQEYRYFYTGIHTHICN